jgi:hypothetical protein
MKTLIAIIALLFAGSALAFCKTGFLKYETPCTGFNKLCHYDVLGDDYAKNVSCVSLCPLTIEVCE